MERLAGYVGGRWSTAQGERVGVPSPTDQRLVGRVGYADLAQVEGAIAAARTAQPGWRSIDLTTRIGVVQQMADELERRADALGDVITSELGMPTALAGPVQVGSAVAVMRAYCEAAPEALADRRTEQSIVRREPVGVLAAVTPWNFPLYQAVCKIVPALLSGSTVVHKGSEVAPLAQYAIADAAAAVGLPPGVYNFLVGPGATLGERLVASPDVDMVSFTGSTAAGTRVAALAAPNVTRVHQELGGKSASIVLDRADLGAAVAQAVGSITFNSGQTCSALTRLVVHRRAYAEVLERIEAEVQAVVLGDPAADDVGMGPVVNQVQFDRIERQIAAAAASGLRVLTGGPGRPPGLERGWFIRPTVFVDVGPDVEVFRSEIFGPVLCVTPAESDDDAVAIANDSEYGLAGAVWAEEEQRALSVADRLETGSVQINGGGFDVHAPFGGRKRSGNGREMGLWGIEEFCELKTLTLGR